HARVDDRDRLSRAPVAQSVGLIAVDEELRALRRGLEESRPAIESDPLDVGPAGERDHGLAGGRAGEDREVLVVVLDGQPPGGQFPREALLNGQPYQADL